VTAVGEEVGPVSALRARVLDYTTTGQPHRILGAESLTAADAALAALDWSALARGTDASGDFWSTVVLIAAFHRHRAALLSGPEQLDEQLMAGDLLAAAHSTAPGGMSEALERSHAAGFPAQSRPARLSRAWYGLGVRVLDHAERTTDPDTVARAAHLFQHCEPAARPGDPHRAVYACNLGTAYMRYFEYTGDRVALTAAVGAFRCARDLTPIGHRNHPAYCSNLGAALAERFDASDRAADLDEAIDAQTTAVDAARGHPDQAFYLSNLGASYTTRFERTADADSLDRAIEALQAAVAATGPDDPDLATREANLGRVRLCRYEQTADTDTLFAAIAALGAAAGATEPGDPDYPPRLSNLAGAFIHLSDRTGDVTSLDLAIEALEEATARPHRLRATHLTNLGTAHQRRARKTGDPASADAAIEAYEQGLGLTAPDDPDRAGRLSNLGNSHLRRAGAGDLERALARLDEAVQAVPADHPDRTAFLTNRADAYAARFTRHADTADLAAALRDYRDAADGPAPALSRARAALRAGRLAASVDPGRNEALDGFAQAIDLVDQVVWRGLSRLDAERLLREFSGAASDAAACAIARGGRDNAGGGPEQALELLERGRGILLGQSLDTRAAYDTLRAEHPGLAQRFATVQQALERPELTRSLSEPHPTTAAMADGERFVALAREREEILAAIQKLPGYGGFPRADPVDGPKAAAAGPVVVVNVSRYRCDALAVTAAGVELIELPRLTADGTARVADGFLKLVRRIRVVSELSPAERRRLESRLREILAWLWDTIAKPVLDHLGLGRRAGQWPRLWWCPTGRLALLPLHCAQRYDPALLTDDGVMDRVAASYTPTLRALVSGRIRLSPDTAADGLLAVAMAQTPGKPSLPGTAAELKAVGATLTPADTLAAERATKHAVISRLREHRWLHYIGHSAQNLQDPGGGALFLQDGPLTMREIAAIHLEHAEFAFLSSCESTLGTTVLPDEMLHLAGALGMAGYRHVIATSWSIRDDMAPRVAGEIYRRLTEGGVFDPAEAGTALHRTLRQIMATQPLLVSAAYSHTGP
jgi:tetratricopeptide (TPR) repeat protein